MAVANKEHRFVRFAQGGPPESSPSADPPGQGAGAGVFLVRVYDGVGDEGDPPDYVGSRHWTYTVKNLAGQTLATTMAPLLVHGHEGGPDILIHGAGDGTYGLGAYDAAGAFALLEAFDEHLNLA